MKKQTLIVLAVVTVVVAPLALGGKKAAEVGEKVADFKLEDLSGKKVDTTDFRKDKVFVLKFGATWCGWCNRQIPHLNKVQKEYGDQVAVLDVSVREKAEKVKPHNKKHKVNYKTVLDTDGSVAGQYGVRGIPVVIVANRKGKVVYRGHYTKFEVLKKHITPLLKKDEG
jgi:peroxiredoxin